MDKGRIVEQGTLHELLAAKAPVLSKLMESHAAGKQTVEEAAEVADPAASSGPQPGEDKGGAATIGAGEAAAAAATGGDSSSDSGGDNDDLTGKETREELGAVKWSVFLKYIKAAGLHHAAGLILFYIGDTAVQALSTYWLVWWDRTDSTGPRVGTRFGSAGSRWCRCVDADRALSICTAQTTVALTSVSTLLDMTFFFWSNDDDEQHSSSPLLLFEAHNCSLAFAHWASTPHAAHHSVLWLAWLSPEGRNCSRAAGRAGVGPAGAAVGEHDPSVSADPRWDGQGLAAVAAVLLPQVGAFPACHRRSELIRFPKHHRNPAIVPHGISDASPSPSKDLMESL